MKVAKVTAPYTVEFEERPMPTYGDDQVLLKILAFGICGSDMQIYHGQHPVAQYPLVMGHEVSAVVDQVGKNVTDFKPGDKVTIEPQVFCGHCKPCQQGRFNVCEDIKVMGVYMDGCNCEYFSCDARYLHHVPDFLTDEQIALVEPLAVGVGSVKRSRTFKGGNVVVVGAGTIGNCAAQAAKGLGAGKVLVTDIVDSKLEYALECGIDYAFNTSKMTLSEAIEKAFGEDKADVIIDCAAVAPVFKSIIEAARPNSEIILTGSYKTPVTFEVPRIQRREISLIGHFMYVREDFADAIRLLSEGKITITKTVSQVYPFDKYDEALKFFDEHPDQVMKIIVKM